MPIYLVTVGAHEEHIDLPHYDGAEEPGLGVKSVRGQQVSCTILAAANESAAARQAGEILQQTLPPLMRGHWVIAAFPQRVKRKRLRQILAEDRRLARGECP